MLKSFYREKLIVIMFLKKNIFKFYSNDCLLNKQSWIWQECVLCNQGNVKRILYFVSKAYGNVCIENGVLCKQGRLIQPPTNKGDITL